VLMLLTSIPVWDLQNFSYSISIAYSVHHLLSATAHKVSQVMLLQCYQTFAGSIQFLSPHSDNLLTTDYQQKCVGQDSVAGIVARYGLDVPGIKPHWGLDFLHLSRLAMGPTQAPAHWTTPLLVWAFMACYRVN
jgi:hypothetical protein